MTLAIAGCAADAETTAPRPQESVATGSLVAAKAVPLACSGGRFAVKIAPDIAARHGHAITTAFGDWQQALGGAVTFEISVDAAAADAWAACEIDVVWQTDERGGIFGEARTESIPGSKRTASSVIYLVAGTSMDVDGVAYATMLHEIGHSLGLEHDTTHGDRTAMWPFLTVPAQVGCPDVRRACEAWGCTPACTGNTWALP